MQNKKNIWTEEMVIHAFEEAIRTLKKLPSVKLNDYFSSWPEIIYSEIEIIKMDQKSRKWPASSESISRLEKVCVWINFLKEIDERKLIWLRAKKTPWQLICREFGISRATANRKWKNSIRQITQKLNELLMFTNT